MTAVAHREVERKYEVPEDAGARVDWDALEGYTVSPEPVEHRMEAVYFDTEDMALGRRLVALRRRRGGADDGWHIKVHESSGRQELQLPLLGTPNRMPASVRRLLAGLTGGQPLRPVATLRTLRRVRTISDPSGTQVAEAADDEVEAVDERTGTTRTWAEWEVELVDGTLPGQRQEEIFAAVEKVVLAAGGAPSASRSKIARALGDEAAAAPAHPHAGRKARKGAPGPELLRTVLAGLAEQLVLWDFKVRIEAPDAVHQMRVTSRSLRSVLRSAAPFLEDGAARELDGRLRSLARALSGARDAEVTAELLPARVEMLGGRVGPDAAQLLRATAEDEARSAARTARRHLDSPEHLQLLEDVRAFAAAPPLTKKAFRVSARDVADTMVRRALEKVVRVGSRGAEAETAGRTGHEQRLEHLHDVRKAVKRVRYVDRVLNRAGFLPGKTMRGAAGDAEEYQDVLGHVMDAAVVEGWLAGTARSLAGSGQDRYAVGVLHGAETVRLCSEVAGGVEVVGGLLARIRADLD